MLGEAVCRASPQASDRKVLEDQFLLSRKEPRSWTAPFNLTFLDDMTVLVRVHQGKKSGRDRRPS